MKHVHEMWPAGEENRDVSSEAEEYTRAIPGGTIGVAAALLCGLFGKTGAMEILVGTWLHRPSVSERDAFVDAGNRAFASFLPSTTVPWAGERSRIRWEMAVALEPYSGNAEPDWEVTSTL